MNTTVHALTLREARELEDENAAPQRAGNDGGWDIQMAEVMAAGISRGLSGGSDSVLCLARNASHHMPVSFNLSQPAGVSFRALRADVEHCNPAGLALPCHG